MKKIICSIILFFLFGIETSSANWYGNHAIAFTNPGGVTLTPTSGGGPNRGTRCDNDGDTTGGAHPTLGQYAVADNNNSTTLTPETDAEFTVGATWNMRCLYWDSSVPIVNTLTYTNGWTNNVNQTVNFSFTDAGGSRLRRYTLQQRIASDNPTFSTWAAWQNVTGHTNQAIAGGVNTFSSSYSFVATNNRAYEFRIQVEDVAWNISVWTTPARTIRIDNQPPIAADISNTSPVSGSDILADNSYTISLTVAVNGGSPITETTGYFENRSSSTGAYITTAFTSPNGIFSNNYDVRNVDLARQVTGARQYSLKVTRLCDQAWNCTTVGNTSWPAVGIRNFTYEVYADTLNQVSSVLANPFSATIVADGVIKNLNIRLRDTYGNIIIPASSIGRTINLSLSINNALRLEQYLNSSSSSAFFTDISSGTWAIALWSSVSKNLGVRTSTTGDYTIPFFVFAPTSLWSSLVPASASINNISFTIAWLGPNSGIIGWSSNININAQPLFTTAFTGEIKTQWFIEWVSQNSTLTVTKANATTTSSPALYFEFGNYNTGTFLNETNSRFNLTLNGISIREGSGTTVPTTTTISGLPLTAGSPTDFTTTMLLQSGAVNTATTSYLASIIWYVNAGRTIMYPYDIIGKTSYHAISGNNNSFQSGVKIIGTTSSQKTEEIVTNQFTGDVQILGNIEKSLARKDIQTNVYELIRNMIPRTAGLTALSATVLNSQNWDDTGLRAEAFYGNKALYFWETIILSGAGNIEGNKTIIVEGNVYITGNIRDTDDDGMLGIIALSKNGVGGNIYIDPSVTDIHAILYADRSVLSYDGVKEFDGSNSSASELANQLYIHGSVFSENTIGWSRKTPIVCPYFVNVTCTQQLAQKYDLNYLRRYFIYDSNWNGTIQPTIDSPANSGTRSFGGAIGTWYEEYPVIIDYNTRVQQTPPPFFGE